MEMKQRQPYMMHFIGMPPPSPRMVASFLGDESSQQSFQSGGDTLYSSLLSRIQAEQKRNRERLEQLRCCRRRRSECDSQKENITSPMNSAIANFESAVRKLVSSGSIQEQTKDTVAQENHDTFAVQERVRRLEGLLNEKSSECEKLKKQIQHLTHSTKEIPQEKVAPAVETQAVKESKEVDSSAGLAEPTSKKELSSSVLCRSNSLPNIHGSLSTSGGWSKSLLSNVGSSSFLTIGELLSTHAIKKTEQEEKSDPPTHGYRSDSLVLLPSMLPRAGLVPLKSHQNLALCSIAGLPKVSNQLCYAPTNLASLSTPGQILQAFGNPSLCAYRCTKVDPLLQPRPRSNSIPEPLPNLAVSPNDEPKEQNEETSLQRPSPYFAVNFVRAGGRHSFMFPSTSQLAWIGYGKMAFSLFPGASQHS